MILKTALLIKLLLPMAVMAGGYRLCKKLSRGQLAGLSALVILFAVIANAASGLVPPLRDEVTLTALGEKREEAQKEEVFLEGYTVDGKEYLAGEDMKLLDGKWFWKGETCCWRIETDARQPEGVTRTITVGIPVGWDRTLNFEGSVWRGLVEISIDGRSWEVDTYADPAETVSAAIGTSDRASLVINIARVLAVYMAVLLVLSGLAFAVFARSWRDPDWVGRNGGKLLYGVVSALVFVLMMVYARSQSLWVDDLLRLKFASGSWHDSLQGLLGMVDVTPPLFASVAWLWYRIAPYGEQWLLLIAIVPTALSSYMAGLNGEALCGKSGGVIAAVLVGFSATLWGHAAFEFSGYAFMVFFTSLSLYAHIKKNWESKERRWQILYSFSLLCLCMSHYFGMLACGLFFMADAELLLQKKISWKAVLTYILPGAASAGWLVLVWRTTLHDLKPAEIAGWYGTPTMDGVRSVLRYLSGNIELLYLLLLLGLGCAIALALSKRAGDQRSFYCKFLTLSIFGTVALLYIYGKYISPRSTMWHGRYLQFLIPFIALLGALTIRKLFGGPDGSEEGTGDFRTKTIAAFLGAYTLLNCVIAAPTCGTEEPFRQAADWLYTQPNTVFNEDAAVIMTAKLVDKSWNDYYVQRQGRRDPLNVLNQDHVNREVLQKYNTVYVQYSHTTMSEELESILNEGFDLKNDLKNINIRVYERRT